MLIIRNIARPFSFVPPLVFALIVYLVFFIADGLVFDAIGLRDALLLPFIGLFTDFVNVENTLSDAQNQGVLAIAMSILFLVLGVVFDRIGKATDIASQVEQTGFGRLNCCTKPKWS